MSIFGTDAPTSHKSKFQRGKRQRRRAQRQSGAEAKEGEAQPAGWRQDSRAKMFPDGTYKCSKSSTSKKKEELIESRLLISFSGTRGLTWLNHQDIMHLVRVCPRRIDFMPRRSCSSAWSNICIIYQIGAAVTAYALFLHRLCLFSLWCHTAAWSFEVVDLKQRSSVF